MSKLKPTMRNRVMSAAFSVAVGVILLLTPLGQGLVRLSFDIQFLVRPTARPADLDDIVIIYMDERSFQELKQPNDKKWDRALHARLVNWLKAEECKLIVFDVFLTEPGAEDANRELVEAIKAHGNVVLAALLDRVVRPGILGEPLLLPRPEFLEHSAGYGIAELHRDTDFVVRRHFAGTSQVPSLPWSAAAAIGAEVTGKKHAPAARLTERWMNYYGRYGTIPNVSYCEVTNQPPGYFKDKIVFVGGRPKTNYSFQEVEEFRVPYTRWTGEQSAGVEVLATTFLNLLRDDWLTEMPRILELGFVVLVGVIAGCGFAGMGLTRATKWAVLSLFFVGSALLLLAQLTHIWFPGLIIVAQIPAALGWSVMHHAGRSKQKTPEPEPPVVQQAPLPAVVVQAGGTRHIPAISDHTLLRCVGKGSYGEVWLGQNAIGTFHAVKIVYRVAFETDEPYEREFRGIQKFMPISHSHPGLVRLLHVGRNDKLGYFFYVMEAADDELTGPTIDPQTYSPKNLAKELKKHYRLPVGQCVELGLLLSDAMDCMHKHHLIHRDLKPANIIYVNGIAKIADIGLVTDMSGEGQSVSYLGTEGYIAPEGPGTAAADVYSLGKVIYEASMGRDRNQFPDLPTSLVKKADNPTLMQLNQIILKACESDPTRRYQSAGQMHADLLNMPTK